MAALALLATREARADDLDDFLFARDAYNNSDYGLAAERLQNLLSLARTPPLRESLVEPAQKYLFASLVLTQHPAEAVALLERMLRANPDLQFNVRDFSAVVLQQVAETRERLLPELNRVREQRVEAQHRADARRAQQREQIIDAATRETIDVPRWQMFVPFGFGQFANGSPALGALFAIIETLALATPVTAYVIDVSPPSTCASSTVIHATCADVLLDMTVVGWSALGVTAVLGIVQANLGYRPERDSDRHRAVPPVLQNLQLGVSVDGQGAILRTGIRF